METPSAFEFPLITEETSDKLLDEWRVDASEETSLESFADEVLTDLVEANPKLVDDIRKVLEVKASESRLIVNDYGLGMMAVLKAFDLQHPYLIAKFCSFTDADITGIITRLNQILPAENANMFARTLNSPKIPQTQVNLQTAVEKIAQKGFMKNPVREGAASMYQILADNWVKLSSTPPPKR